VLLAGALVLRGNAGRELRQSVQLNGGIGVHWTPLPDCAPEAAGCTFQTNTPDRFRHRS
jgi:hypothetical protein